MGHPYHIDIDVFLCLDFEIPCRNVVDGRVKGQHDPVHRGSPIIVARMDGITAFYLGRANKIFGNKIRHDSHHCGQQAG